MQENVQIAGEVLAVQGLDLHYDGGLTGFDLASAIAGHRFDHILQLYASAKINRFDYCGRMRNEGNEAVQCCCQECGSMEKIF